MDESGEGRHLGDPARLAQWRRRLLAKGGEVAKALEELLAGKEVDLGAALAPGKPADDPELRLRGFLERIDRGIKRSRTDRFGRCGVCGAALPAHALDEVPWTERCAQHPES